MTFDVDLMGLPPKPEIMLEITKILKTLYPNISNNIITNVLLERIALMLNSKRITLEEPKGHLMPNWFALIFLKSGGGKDRLVNDLDDFVFGDFRQWYEAEARRIYKQLLVEINKSPKNAEEQTAETRMKGEENVVRIGDACAF